MLAKRLCISGQACFLRVEGALDDLSTVSGRSRAEARSLWYRPLARTRTSLG